MRQLLLILTFLASSQLCLSQTSEKMALNEIIYGFDGMVLNNDSTKLSCIFDCSGELTPQPVILFDDIISTNPDEPIDSIPIKNLPIGVYLFSYEVFHHSNVAKYKRPHMLYYPDEPRTPVVLTDCVEFIIEFMECQEPQQFAQQSTHFPYD